MLAGYFKSRLTMSDKDKRDDILGYWYIGFLPLKIQELTGFDYKYIIDTIEKYSQ